MAVSVSPFGAIPPEKIEGGHNTTAGNLIIVVDGLAELPAPITPGIYNVVGNATFNANVHYSDDTSESKSDSAQLECNDTLTVCGFISAGHNFDMYGLHVAGQVFPATAPDKPIVGVNRWIALPGHDAYYDDDIIVSVYEDGSGLFDGNFGDTVLQGPSLMTLTFTAGWVGATDVKYINAQVGGAIEAGGVYIQGSGPIIESPINTLSSVIPSTIISQLAPLIMASAGGNGSDFADVIRSVDMRELMEYYRALPKEEQKRIRELIVAYIRAMPEPLRSLARKKLESLLAEAK